MGISISISLTQKNNKINQIATEIFNYYTQDSVTSPFSRLDDNLINNPQLCLKIFEKSLSKIIDSKKANGKEVNKGKINQEFIEHLESSRVGEEFLSYLSKNRDEKVTAPSANPSSPRARGGGSNPPAR